MSEPPEPEQHDPRDQHASDPSEGSEASGGSDGAEGSAPGGSRGRDGAEGPAPGGSRGRDGAEGSAPGGSRGRDGMDGARSPGGEDGARSVQRPPMGPVAAWRTFRHTPFFPATVLALIVAAAAGLFAVSYIYAMADPTPRTIPTALVERPADDRNARVFIDGLEKELGSSVRVRRYRTFARAKEAVEDQKVFAVLRADGGDGSRGGDRGGRGGHVELNLSSAAGASVAEVLEDAAPKVGKKAGVSVSIKDLKPLGKGDPRGLTIFYMTLAADVIGFIGAIQLTLNVPELSPAARISFIAAYALIGGFIIAAMVGWLLQAVHLPFVHSWLILALTMFTSGMVFVMFNALIGRWAMIPTWLVMVLLGNPSSGGAVSWPLLPSALGAVGRWLPPGASVNAQHTAVYFPDNEHVLPYLVLAAWASVGLAVFLWRHARRRAKER